MAQMSPQERLALLRQHQDGVPWTRIAVESGVPVRTLARWAALTQPPVACNASAAPITARDGYRQSWWR